MDPPVGWRPPTASGRRAGGFLAFGGPSGIDVADPDGGGHREITRGPDYAPAWSPDGAGIAFRRGPYFVSELWIVRPDGTGACRLLGGLHDHGPGNDVLIGRGDPDLLVGGPGRDRIDAGPFADTVRARDGWRDTIDCGPGLDTVEADTNDVVAADCERVTRSRA
jgi:hypothetical protein